MKIDTHIHITPPEIIKNFKKYAEKESYFRLLSNAPHNRFASYEEVVNHLNENQFDKGVVFGFGFQDIGLCRYVNDYTIEAIKKHPNMLIGFMVVPVRHPEMNKEIRRCYEGGLKGIGELFPEGQHMCLDSFNDLTFKNSLLDYNLPLLIHTNEIVGHYYAGKTNISMKSLEIFIRNHKDIPIILAHFGGGLLFFELMKELKDSFKNVYYDTSAGIFLYDKAIYNVAREIGILNKILFGTDYPLLPIRRYEESLNTLNNNEKTLIQGQNAYNLFHQLGIL